MAGTSGSDPRNKFLGSPPRKGILRKQSNVKNRQRSSISRYEQSFEETEGDKSMFKIIEKDPHQMKDQKRDCDVCRLF